MKITLLLEYVRVDYITTKNGEKVLDFFNSRMGKKLRDYLRPYNLTPKDIDVEFVYPLVPEPSKVSRTGDPISYKNPPAAKLKEPIANLKKRLVASKPDVVLPTGALGSKLLTGVGAITKTRGVPVETTFEEDGDSHTFWTLPIFSIEFVSAQPNNEGILKTDLSTLAKFLEDGEKAFTPNEVNSELVMSIDRVEQIFAHINTHKPLTAWDLETNTLHGEYDGAKVLVLSLSYEEGKGFTIPINHKESPFNEAEVDRIYELLKAFVADPNIVKVGQNIGFEIRYLRLLKGFTVFNQHRDTKVAYYLTMSQERNDSFRLTDLAYELTDMGGYDKPLEQFFRDYRKDYEDREKIRVKEEKEAQDVLIKEYRATHKGTIASAREALGLEAPKVVPLVNEVDGGKINYEWAPLEVMHPYASGDADCTLRIHNKLYEVIATRPEWVQLFTEFYPRLTVALALTEANGMYMDKEYMENASIQYTKEAEELKVKLDNHPAIAELKSLWQDLYEAGLEEMNKPPAERDKEIAKFRNKYRDKLKEGFNPGSSEDKGRLLFQVMGYLPPAERDFLTTGANDKGLSGDKVTWEDFSTSRGTIEWIIEHYPESADLCNLMLDYAKVNTINNTFVSGLLQRIDDPKGDGFIHGSLNETGTECVSGDTLLITDKGIIPIEELSDMRDERTFEDIDIKVHSINGEERADGFYHNGVRDGLKITLAEGTEIITSKNHPIMSSTHFKKGVHINNHQASYFKQVEENVWREASDLVVGDYVMLKPGTEMYGDMVELVYDTSKYIPTATSQTKQAILPDEMTEDLGLWLGMYMADGSLSKNNGSVALTLTNSDLSILEIFKELTDKLFNLEATIRHPENRTSYVQLSSKHVGNWLCDLFKLSSRSEMKDVPPQVLQASKQVQVSFIRGLTLDTATESRGYHSLTFSSVSKPLMVKIRTMLLNMGIVTRISKCKGYKVGAQPLYKVPVTYGNLDKFMEDIGVLQTTKEHRIAHKKANAPVRKNRHRKMQGVLEADTHILVKVLSIEPVSDVRLYDLHVPGSHSFVGNGVMNHNTSRLSSSNPNLNLGVV